MKLFIVLKDELRQHGIQIGRDGFYKLLKQHELLIKRRKRYVQTTQSFHRFKKWDDLTINLCIESIEELWVSDITYLRTETGFVYLSLITDVYSRKIVGYHLSQKLKVDGCIRALNKAIASLTDLIIDEHLSIIPTGEYNIAAISMYPFCRNMK